MKETKWKDNRRKSIATHACVTCEKMIGGSFILTPLLSGTYSGYSRRKAGGVKGGVVRKLHIRIGTHYTHHIYIGNDSIHGSPLPGYLSTKTDAKTESEEAKPSREYAYICSILLPVAALAVQPQEVPPSLSPRPPPH